MNKLLLIIMILFSIKEVNAQKNKMVSIRDFKSVSDYSKFFKYRDSLNNLNKVKLEYEYLESFKKQLVYKDSIKKVQEKIFKVNLKNEYISETSFNDYVGTYELEKVNNVKFESYDAKMYFTENGISILSKNNYNEDLRISFDFEIKSKLKNTTFRKGAFHTYKGDSISVLTISSDNSIVAVTIDKDTKVFLIKNFKKESLEK